MNDMGFAVPDLGEPQRIAKVAALLRNWPEMWAAIDALIERQQEIVAWWDDHVPPGRPKVSHDSGILYTSDEAQKLIGWSDSSVSRFRVALSDISAYRNRLSERFQREAGLLNKDPSATRPTPNRDGPDFWPTPASLVQACVQHVVPLLPAHDIWECASGDGRLAHAFIADGRSVMMTDKYPQQGAYRLDFLTEPPPDRHLIAVTNPPYSQTDEFITRGLALLDRRAILGLVLLLRHDHFQAGGRVEAFNRATFEVHCNWRPIWIEGTDGQPRWSFTWVGWLDENRHPPLYLASGS